MQKKSPNKRFLKTNLRVQNPKVLRKAADLRQFRNVGGVLCLPIILFVFEFLKAVIKGKGTYLWCLDKKKTIELNRKKMYGKRLSLTKEVPNWQHY